MKALNDKSLRETIGGDIKPHEGKQVEVPPVTGQTKSTTTNTVAANDAYSAVPSQASPDRHENDPVSAILNANQEVPPEARPTSAPTGLFKMGRSQLG